MSRLAVYVLIMLLLCIAVQHVYGQKKKAPADTILSETFISRANKALATPKRSDSLATIIFNHAKRVNNVKYAARGAVMKFTALLLLNGADKAKPWYDTAKFYLARSQDHLWTGYANMNLGSVLRSKYRFEEGVRYLLIANGEFEKAKDTNMVALSLISIAGAFHDMGSYESGKRYAREAIAIIKTMPKASPELKWRALGTLEINYDDNKEYNKALAASFENIKNAAGDDKLLTTTYNNIGNTYQKKGDLARALVYFKIALQKATKAGTDYDLATIYNNLSNVNLLQDNLKASSRFIDSAIFYSKRTDSPEKLIDTYETAYKLYHRTGDNSNAFKYLALHARYKDSLLSAEKARSVYDLQLKYETEKKDRQNQQLAYKARLERAERTKAEAERHLVTVVAVTAIIILTLIFGFIYRNRLIRHRHDEKQAFNKAIFEGEQNERIRIARDLHDSIGQMLSVVKMNVSVLEGDRPDEAVIKNALTLVDKTINEVRHISHNLLPEGLNLGLFAALQDLCDKVNATGSTEVMLNVPDDIRSYQFAKPNELSIYRIVQEVLNNMIKHAQATHIDIDVIEVDNDLTLSIRDNGQGFDTGQIGQSKGIGWKNIAARVNLLDGQMQVMSEHLKGTHIQIVIPRV